MSLEFVPPKYAQLVNELQRRIASGEYAPGSMMPSEHQLTEEFSVSRPTIVRALAVLRDGGWIESRQGKGRYVRGRPALEALKGARPGEALLSGAHASGQGEITHAEVTTAPNRIADLLGVPAKAKVFRRRQVLADEDGPSQIACVWMPVNLAEGTDLTGTDSVGTSLREHVESRKNVRFDHITERVTARQPTGEEAATLNMGRSVPVLAVYSTVRDAGGGPLLVIETVLPADRHELEDAYSLD